MRITKGRGAKQILLLRGRFFCCFWDVICLLRVLLVSRPKRGLCVLSEHSQRVLSTRTVSTAQAYLNNTLFIPFRYC